MFALVHEWPANKLAKRKSREDRWLDSVRTSAMRYPLLARSRLFYPHQRWQFMGLRLATEYV
jgi:hypothetical protein